MGRFFKQVSGIAMGASCSPDLANLYAAALENANRSKFVRHPQVLGYGRYIDDTLALVWTQDSASCHAILSQLELGPLDIEWDIVEEGKGTLPFLDLEIMVLPESSTIDYKLYRKPFNHFMRIPWESSHPITVKRAGYIGEVTRLATCSSKLSFYNAAIAEYREILVAHGFPQRVLHSWATDYVNKAWVSAHSDSVKEVQPHPLIIKTQYNDVWNNVKINRIRETIFGTWNQVFSSEGSEREREFVQSMDSTRMLIAFRETKSLGDLVSGLNARRVNEMIDEDVLNEIIPDEAGTPPDAYPTPAPPDSDDDL